VERGIELFALVCFREEGGEKRERQGKRRVVAPFFSLEKVSPAEGRGVFPFSLGRRRAGRWKEGERGGKGGGVFMSAL